MSKGIKHISFWTGIPPWIFIGAAAVLLPIFSFVAIENIHRQKENSIHLLLEKGAALIRSFEAGTRTGMMGTHFSEFQLQNLLAETALQQDIKYLLVVDTNGIILAHNDIAQIGKFYGRELNLKQLSLSRNLKWRILKRPDGKKVFEVLRRFAPTGGHMAGTNMLRLFQQLFPSHLSQWRGVQPPGYIIFIGLDMSSIEEAEKADVEHAVVMAAILLFIGFAGIILLFFTHNYRATKASLSRIKAFSDNLVENIPIGLIAIDDGKKIAQFNHVAEKVLCVSAKNVIGKDVSEVLPKELYEQIDDDKIKDGIVEKEVECVAGNGEDIPLEISASLLKDDAGTFLGHVLLFKDLTEVRGLKKTIARSQRLVSVGRLAAGVAHEIRNPLSSIKGFATYFKERYRDIPEDQEIADIMIQEVDRLNRVVGQLLEFARPVSISRKQTDLHTLIRDSLKLIEKQAQEKNINIHTRLDDAVQEAFIDPDKISQVLLNFYLNAVEAMDNGGTLSVDLLKKSHPHGIIIKVSDTGSGIQPKDLPHIFDPYYTTKASGTGIGLSIVHNTIEAHNGEIKVESLPGQGSSFTIVLPDTETGKES